ncbi:MAG TPA: iron-sulfur cluster-binding protein, partial [bacterium (Candidatus Stahlbacteria)]|nr:iron-sulfur cluster-binding protein [Candidatus Stahlbacteria bacterium]
MHRTKVAIVKCEGYGERQVSSAVSGLFKLLGGIERFVKQNDRVLLKPNLLTGKPPEAG